MTERRYEATPELTRELAEPILARNDPSELPSTLVGISYHEPDWRWVEEQLIKFTESPSDNVRRVAAMCFEDLARIHRVLDREKVFPILEKLLQDPNPDVAAQAEETLENVKYYLGRRRGRRE